MKKIILMGMPNHGNIGDSVIFYAEDKFIKKNFPEFDYYIIPEKRLDLCAEKIKKYCNEDDILCFHGGGNIGNQYIIEKFRRKAIQLFPNNKIIIFPQTIYFSNDEEGKKELEITKNIYSNHKNLILVIREEESLSFAKEHFKNNRIIFTPDIVTSLNETNTNQKREGLLYLMRQDVERNICDYQKQILDNITKKYFNKLENSDIASKERINGDKREKIINDKFNQIRKSEMVITDRLHGMIFCAITSTPCIALGNYNHKVKSSFLWFKDLGYIKFVESFNEKEIEDNIKYLKKIGKIEYNNEKYLKELHKIVECIKES